MGAGDGLWPAEVCIPGPTAPMRTASFLGMDGKGVLACGLPAVAWEGINGFVSSHSQGINVVRGSTWGGPHPFASSRRLTPIPTLHVLSPAKHRREYPKTPAQLHSLNGRLQPALRTDLAVDVDVVPANWYPRALSGIKTAERRGTEWEGRWSVVPFESSVPNPGSASPYRAPLSLPPCTRFGPVCSTAIPTG